MRDIATLLPRAIGPFDRYCVGCHLAPTESYVTTPLIGLGVATLPAHPGEPTVLTQTLAFDRAESEFANLTQTNMVTVSSFCGLQGLLWGYDLLPQPLRPHPLLDMPQVYDLAPLLDATRSLYGTVAEKRFPIAPGQHLLCACKTRYHPGPCHLYGALAIAIAADRTCQADLFLEDHGAWEIREENGDGVQGSQRVAERRVLRALVDATKEIGDNLGVHYARILVGLRTRQIEAGEIGCALTAVPYIRLARHAVPEGNPLQLARMALPEWEQAVSSRFLSAHPIQIPVPARG